MNDKNIYYNPYGYENFLPLENNQLPPHQLQLDSLHGEDPK